MTGGVQGKFFAGIWFAYDGVLRGNIRLLNGRCTGSTKANVLDYSVVFSAFIRPHGLIGQRWKKTIARVLLESVENRQPCFFMGNAGHVSENIFGALGISRWD